MVFNRLRNMGIGIAYDIRDVRAIENSLVSFL